jgi:hypothetical protein
MCETAGAVKDEAIGAQLRSLSHVGPKLPTCHPKQAQSLNGSAFDLGGHIYVVFS